MLANKTDAAFLHVATETGMGAAPMGGKGAGDAPLACDAVQVVFVTWLGMAGLVGVGSAARIT